MTEASDLRSCQVLRPLAPWLFVPSMLTQASSEEDRLLPKEQADYTCLCITRLFQSRYEADRSTFNANRCACLLFVVELSLVLGAAHEPRRFAAIDLDLRPVQAAR